MKICLNCYKKLEQQMFSPYDYFWSSKAHAFISSCCEMPIKEIDGRKYKKTVKDLKEKKKLQEWDRLTPKQKSLLMLLQETREGDKHLWIECFQNEWRTAKALKRKGLIETDDKVDPVSGIFEAKAL